jgi:DNA-directed RNA polymerase subunit M/transcription elongation factor TFIIS
VTHKRKAALDAENNPLALAGEAACSECGSSRLAWRVRRTPGVNEGMAVYLVWTCRECETTWIESVAPEPGELA